MHTFCDASSSSYACMVYLRTEGKDGVKNIQLLQAKSRVAPLWKTTVPRLGLLVCCIGAHLAYSMKEAMTLEDVSSFFRIDSMTVHYLIMNKEKTGKNLSIIEILRLVAWILRFGCNSRYHNSKRGELTVNEIQIAEKKLLKLVQQKSFDDTVTQNKLKSLNSFTDNEGLMRLKTKIVRRKDDENFICPIVLSSRHLLVERLIFENHTNSCHSGTQAQLVGEYLQLDDIQQLKWPAMSSEPSPIEYVREVLERGQLQLEDLLQ
ncbi:integrase catalytic domain-containing protein [Trichonephila clavipes]|nr:integrase catalytic domain-containing protein [Trichonephila clavipes]